MGTPVDAAQFTERSHISLGEERMLRCSLRAVAWIGRLYERRG